MGRWSLHPSGCVDEVEQLGDFVMVDITEHCIPVKGEEYEHFTA